MMKKVIIALSILISLYHIVLIVIKIYVTNVKKNIKKKKIELIILIQ